MLNESLDTSLHAAFSIHTSSGVLTITHSTLPKLYRKKSRGLKFVAKAGQKRQTIKQHTWISNNKNIVYRQTLYLISSSQWNVLRILLGLLSCVSDVGVVSYKHNVHIYAVCQMQITCIDYVKQLY